MLIKIKRICSPRCQLSMKLRIFLQKSQQVRESMSGRIADILLLSPLFLHKTCVSQYLLKIKRYQAYERGIALPNLKNFVKLADIFDVSLDYLLGRKEY